MEARRAETRSRVRIWICLRWWRASRPSTYSGDVNISYYTRAQLPTGVGTAVWCSPQVGRESRLGRILGRLTDAVEAMGEVDTERLLRRALHMSELFTSLERDLPKYLSGLLREARYLLRSCLYAQAIADGRPCFSIRELAARHNDPHLASLLASRQERRAID